MSANARTDTKITSQQRQSTSENRHAVSGVATKCEACGNEYDKAFQVIKDGQTHTYDSQQSKRLWPSQAGLGGVLTHHAGSRSHS
jgi:hypothetical protein